MDTTPEKEKISFWEWQKNFQNPSHFLLQSLWFLKRLIFKLSSLFIQWIKLHTFILLNFYLWSLIFSLYFFKFSPLSLFFKFWHPPSFCLIFDPLTIFYKFGGGFLAPNPQCSQKLLWQLKCTKIANLYIFLNKKFLKSNVHFLASGVQ